jgi:hypothetical protein
LAVVVEGCCDCYCCGTVEPGGVVVIRAAGILWWMMGQNLRKNADRC